jgi:hypothetical protein
MATLAEIRNLFNDDNLRNRVAVACVIAIDNILETGTATASQKKFALECYTNPDEIAKKVMMAVLANNKGKTVAEILALTDNAIQNRVNAVTPNIIDALFGV